MVLVGDDSEMFVNLATDKSKPFVLGHEIVHNLDNANGVSNANDAREAYADNMGSNLDFNFGMEAYLGGIDTHYGDTSHTDYTRSSYLNNTNQRVSVFSKGDVDQLTVYVHGTFSSADAVDPELIKEISKTYKEDVVLLDWSGGNTPQARLEAARALNELISHHQFKYGEDLNLIGHSHGGNVIKLYSNNRYARPIDSVVTLATPNRDDYKFNKNSLTSDGHYYNVYDSRDPVQGFFAQYDTYDDKDSFFPTIKGPYSSSHYTSRGKNVEIRTTIDSNGNTNNPHSAITTARSWKQFQEKIK